MNDHFVEIQSAFCYADQKKHFGSPLPNIYVCTNRNYPLLHIILKFSGML